MTLLERGREIEVLDDLLAQARGRRGRAVLIEASAGLGKTSLLGAAGDLAAEAGYVCLRARATELERDFAYGCVRQLLEPAVARASEADREEMFAGAAALAAPLFGPVLGATPPPAVDAAFSILHGLYWLAANIAEERPLALLVDDLQWADAETLRFLNYLAPRLDGIALALVASTRPEASRSGELPRLATAPETTVLRPRPLSPEAAARLCEQLLGRAVAPEFAAACREATGGNPFFIEALVREAGRRGLEPDADAAPKVRDIGPAEVASAVLLRLADRADAGALVRALAVLGDGASLAETAELAGLSEADAAAAADLLAALSIVRSSAPLEFAHPVVREAVYADIGPSARAQGHRPGSGTAGCPERVGGADRRPDRRVRAGRRLRAGRPPAPGGRRRPGTGRARRSQRVAVPRTRRATSARGPGGGAHRARVGRASAGQDGGGRPPHRGRGAGPRARAARRGIPSAGAGPQRLRARGSGRGARGVGHHRARTGRSRAVAAAGGRAGLAHPAGQRRDPGSGRPEAGATP